MHQRQDSGKVPPGPGFFQSCRTLLRLKSGEMGVYEELFDTYGDIVSLRSPQGDDIIMAFHPDYVQRILLDHNSNYPKGRRYNQLELVLGKGLVNSEGRLWLKQRRLLQDLFTRKATLQFLPVITRHTEIMLGRWKTEGARVRDINSEMLSLTFAIAGEAFLGAAIDKHAAMIQDSFKFALSVALRRMYALINLPIHWPLPEHIRFHRAMARIDRVIYDIMDSYKETIEGTDNVLVRLLALLDPDTGKPLPRRQIRDEVNTILMVGHETSSVTITWALYLLVRFPEVRANLVDEIDRKLGGSIPDAHSIEDLSYLRMFVQESLRFYPSVPFILREAAESDQLGPYTIRRGSTICVCPWVTHRHPKFWRNPGRFWPERFNDSWTPARHRCAYVPFGAGPRTCIGEFMAQLEVKMILIRILQEFELEPASGFEPVCRGFISLHPVTGMPILCRPRTVKRRPLTEPSPMPKGAER